MCSGPIPVGFRFSPTDLELVAFFLYGKVSNQQSFSFIEDMDVYGCAPWLLPHKANNVFKENEWFYFVRRTRASEKNMNGKRPRRSVSGKGNGGRWKSTEAETPIFDQNYNIVGYKQSLTFFMKEEGKKTGTKTDWLMKEYRLVSNTFQEWVLCRIHYKTRRKSFAVPNPAPLQHVLDEVPQQSPLECPTWGLLEQNMDVMLSEQSGTSGVRDQDIANKVSELEGVLAGAPDETKRDEGSDLYSNISCQNALDQVPWQPLTECQNWEFELENIAAVDTDGITLEEIEAYC